MKNVSKTYITLLKELNLYVSSEGKKRPVYSLRHYYATQRLLDGVNVYDLSRNMGTSVKQIENHYGHVLATQKSKELIQGTSKSDYQQNEEFRQEFGADLPQYNSFVLGEDDDVSNNKIEDLLKQAEKYANDIIKNEDDKKKMQEFLANKLKSI